MSPDSTWNRNAKVDDTFILRQLEGEVWFVTAIPIIDRRGGNTPWMGYRSITENIH